MVAVRVGAKYRFVISAVRRTVLISPVLKISRYSQPCVLLISNNHSNNNNFGYVVLYENKYYEQETQRI